MMMPIKAAVEHHMIVDETICWERAGLYYLEEKQEPVAQFYLRNSMNAYQRWGADAKVRQMQAVYEQLKKHLPKRIQILSLKKPMCMWI